MEKCDGQHVIDGIERRIADAAEAAQALGDAGRLLTFARPEGWRSTAASAYRDSVDYLRQRCLLSLESLDLEVGRLRGCKTMVLNAVGST
ncbi:MAG: hypothetical protein LBG60_17640 [Bifidobacteriaceae bacterium]|jgi:hypothetical protein|nr:hypothetical protein [Bifidobacteriaceae bacterium]